MPKEDPNVSALRGQPIWGNFIFKAFRNIQRQLANVSVQANAALDAPQNAAPPQINALKVTASGGVAHVQITDNNQVYRGISYHVDVATDPAFSAPCTFHMGPSRDFRIPVGTQPLYYRAFSDYATSPPSAPVYHGGAAPTPVAASGTSLPAIPQGQGSGTGYAGQISGHGIIPFRGMSVPKRS